MCFCLCRCIRHITICFSKIKLIKNKKSTQNKTQFHFKKRENFRGDFISFENNGKYNLPKVIFNPTQLMIDNALASAVSAILPLIEHTAQVRHFVRLHSHCAYGMVSQAFCAEISKHLKVKTVFFVFFFCFVFDIFFRAIAQNVIQTKKNNQQKSQQSMQFFFLKGF